MKGAYYYNKNYNKNCEIDWRGSKIMTSVSGGIKIMSKKVCRIALTRKLKISNQKMLEIDAIEF
jgi:hypothetical protein